LHREGKEMDLLWISGREVGELLETSSVNFAVEEAFKQHGLGNVEMPAKIYLNFEEFGGDLRSMPAYIPELGAAGVKVVNVHPSNPGKGLPTVMATFLLIEPHTGRPLSAMNATHLTDMRTGAGGAVAAKYLARKDSSTLGLIGSGRQARTQLLATSEYFGLEKVLVASRHRKHAEDFVQELGSAFDVEACGIKKACSADIVATTTPSREPIVKSRWVGEGTHINAIGADAPGKQELEVNLLHRARVVVDSLEQGVHSGEVNVPIREGQYSQEDIYAQLGEVVAGKKLGRLEDEDITIFDSTGLAVQDVATASLVYNQAKGRDLGIELEF